MGVSLMLGIEKATILKTFKKAGACTLAFNHEEV